MDVAAIFKDKHKHPILQGYLLGFIFFNREIIYKLLIYNQGRASEYLDKVLNEGTIKNLYPFILALVFPLILSFLDIILGFLSSFTLKVKYRIQHYINPQDVEGLRKKEQADARRARKELMEDFSAEFSAEVMVINRIRESVLQQFPQSTSRDHVVNVIDKENSEYKNRKQKVINKYRDFPS